jgi:hypothetical protein
MSSGNKATISSGLKRFLLFAVFPIFMLPFLFIYSYSAWWLLRLLDGFPGGFYKRHPNLTVTALVIIVCCLLIITGQSMWGKMKARLS